MDHSFAAVPHFYGYEGRCGHPSRFDANYSYTLGCVAALLILRGYSGLIAYANHLEKCPEEWVVGAVPYPSLLTLTQKQGKKQAVVEKTIVSLTSKPYRYLCYHREEWKKNDDYQMPGPIQFGGERALTDTIPYLLCF
jgi:pyrophosphate--fructose-6-phosphate 1-phosphotransferase